MDKLKEEEVNLNKPLYLKNMTVDLYSNDEYRMDISIDYGYITLDKEETIKLYKYLKKSLEE